MLKCQNQCTFVVIEKLADLATFTSLLASHLHTSLPAAENVTINSLPFPALAVTINIFLYCSVKVKPFTAAAPESLCLMLEF